MKYSCTTLVFPCRCVSITVVFPYYRPYTTSGLPNSACSTNQPVAFPLHLCCHFIGGTHHDNTSVVRLYTSMVGTSVSIILEELTPFLSRVAQPSFLPFFFFLASRSELQRRICKAQEKYTKNLKIKGLLFWRFSPFFFAPSFPI